MLERLWGRRRKRSDQQDSEDGSQRKRFRPFKKFRERMREFGKKIIDSAKNFLPSWLLSSGLQLLLVFIGAPWWVWPIVAIVLFALLGGWGS